MSPEEIKALRPFTPKVPQIHVRPDPPNAMETKAKACGNKPSQKGTCGPQVTAGVSGENERTDFALRGYNEPPKAVAPPPRMQPPMEPQKAMHKAAAAVAPAPTTPAADAAVAGKQSRACRPTMAATSSSPSLADLAAKDALNVDLPIERPPGMMHPHADPVQQKHESDGEDGNPYPTWAQNILDYINDDRDDDLDHPDPQDQCELASPATRLYTASGYNRQH